MIDIMLTGKVATDFVNSHTPPELDDTRLIDDIRLEFPSYAVLANSKEDYENMMMRSLTEFGIMNKTSLSKQQAKKFAKIMKDDIFICNLKIIGYSDDAKVRPIFDVNVKQNNAAIIDIIFKFDESAGTYNISSKENTEDVTDLEYAAFITGSVFKIALKSISYLNTKAVTKIITKEIKNPKKKSKNKKSKKSNIIYVYKTRYKFENNILDSIENQDTLPDSIEFQEKQLKTSESGQISSMESIEKHEPIDYTETYGDCELDKRSYERKTDCWQVRGFYRTYKKGTDGEYKIWISPTVKGDRELAKNNPDAIKKSKYKITRTDN